MISGIANGIFTSHSICRGVQPIECPASTDSGDTDQTPGELRAHSGRLHTFTDNAAVVDALTGLAERVGNPLAVKLPRTRGRKDAEYMHLFSGPIDVDAHASQAQAEMATGTSDRANVSELAQRISRLEAEVAEIKEQLKKSL